MVPMSGSYGPDVTGPHWRSVCGMDGESATMSVDHEPWAPTQNLRAQIHETHTGVVVLVGDRAYKGKKPITTDSSTSARQNVANMPVSAKSG
jgi:hypothetical protein